MIDMMTLEEIEELTAECSFLIHGKCTTRRCLIAGGWDGETVPITAEPRCAYRTAVSLAVTRIPELEAERDEALEGKRNFAQGVKVARKRIAELEAEAAAGGRRHARLRSGIPDVEPHEFSAFGTTGMCWKCGLDEGGQPHAVFRRQQEGG